MNKREWNGNMVGMYGAIYRFFTILLMYIYRKATKVQVKIVLKTSLEQVYNTFWVQSSWSWSIYPGTFS